MMKAEISFVSASEIPFPDKAREVIAGLLNFFDLFGAGALASECESSGLQHFAHFADFMNFGLSQFAGEKAAALTLMHQPFTEQTSQRFANRRTVDLKFLRPELFDDPIVGRNLQDQNSMAQLFISQFGLSPFSAWGRLFL